ncbi:kinase-like domain-containing protein [Zopfochytrium polystomum]|nr:kinase-like domain-containing protein [Zopfochytrium polystomum]
MPLFKPNEIKYDPNKPIGSGSFGQVFQGTFQRYTRVAIKVIPFARNEGSKREKLLREALVMMKSVSQGLSPFVIAFHGYVVEGGSLKLVMEYADLGSLHEYIKETSRKMEPVAVWTRVTFLHQVSLGMRFLHHQKIHHHDLKSLNVLMTQAGPNSEIIAKISDFGLSRMVEDGLTVIASIDRQGSRFWKAPERQAWKPMMTPKSDVFSFAVLLTEIILWSWRGVYGFTFEYLQKNSFEPSLCRDKDFRAVVFANMDETCFHANAYSPYGPQLRSIFERCWADSPNDRPDFEKVSKDLGRLLGYEEAEDSSGGTVLSTDQIALDRNNATGNAGGPSLNCLFGAAVKAAAEPQGEEETQFDVYYSEESLSSLADDLPMSSIGSHNELEVPRNLTEAADSFRKAAMQGDAQSQNELGWLYLQGQGIYKDPTQAAFWFQKSAEQRNALAQNNLGMLYQQGNGVPKNLTEAAHWLTKAASQGFAVSQYNLGLLYRDGTGVSKDPSEAARWFRQAADNGYSSALTELGILYRDGDGVPQDPVEAARLFRNAAEQGNPAGQSELGTLYLFGQGVPKDPTLAAAWFQKSADQGNAVGQHNLGVLYCKGEGVQMDLSEAERWFRKAAEQGDVHAQRNLGLLLTRQPK